MIIIQVSINSIQLDTCLTEAASLAFRISNTSLDQWVGIEFTKDGLTFRAWWDEEPMASVLVHGSWHRIPRDGGGKWGENPGVDDYVNQLRGMNANG